MRATREHLERAQGHLRELASDPQREEGRLLATLEQQAALLRAQRHHFEKMLGEKRLTTEPEAREGRFRIELFLAAFAIGAGAALGTFSSEGADRVPMMVLAGLAIVLGVPVIWLFLLLPLGLIRRWLARL